MIDITSFPIALSQGYICDVGRPRNIVTERMSGGVVEATLGILVVVSTNNDNLIWIRKKMAGATSAGAILYSQTEPSPFGVVCSGSGGA